MTDSGCFGLATDALARIVVIDYTREQDFDGADLVLDGFGRPDAPVSVLPILTGSIPPGRLDLEPLRRLTAGSGSAG